MIATSHADDIETLRLEHGKANAFDLELCRGLNDALADASNRTGPLVITGAGSIFSAGVDLFRVVEGGRAYIQEFLPALNEVFLRVFTLPRPVVAAINGHAIAGGCILACACDYRVMAEGKGRIGVPELSVGVPFPAAVVELMRAVIDPGRLNEFLLVGRTYEPAEAASVHLVDEVVEAEHVVERAREVAHELGSRPAASYRITKNLLREPAAARMREAERTQPELIDAWASPETLNAVRSFLARTLKK